MHLAGRDGQALRPELQRARSSTEAWVRPRSPAPYRGPGARGAADSRPTWSPEDHARAWISASGRRPSGQTGGASTEAAGCPGVVGQLPENQSSLTPGAGEAQEPLTGSIDLRHFDKSFCSNVNWMEKGTLKNL